LSPLRTVFEDFTDCGEVKMGADSDVLVSGGRGEGGRLRDGEDDIEAKSNDRQKGI
jgi:hypothetical protein